MKSSRSPLTSSTSLRTIRRALSSRRLRIAALAVAALAGLPQYAPAQTDNFNSGALGPNWATTLSANYPGTISFVPDPFGGQALRLVATTSLLSGSGNDQDSPRILAWRTDRLYTNFYVAVDVLGWNTSIDRNTNGPLIALLARLTNVVRNPSVPVGRPDTMILWLNYNRFGGPGGGTRGVIDLGHLTDGQGDTPNDTLGVQGEFTLNPGHAYRMVFTGTNLYDGSGVLTNSVYYGRIYDLQDLTRPLATVFCPDPFPGYGGFFGYPLWTDPGYLGLASVGDGASRTTDVTFDNFVAAEYPPTSVSFPGTTNGEAGVPQVVNRTPASYSNFYSPAGGISFTATTLGGGNVTTVKLFLNGVDVSSSLNNPAGGNSRDFSFPGSGLTANTVYDARIELANALGQKTTNSWTFDTFSDAYLASAVCQNIECEDWDFGAAQFIDNPLASGFSTNTTIYNDGNLVLYPWTGAFNQGSSAFVNQGTASDQGVDFFDYDTANKPAEADFRPVGSVGTSQGCASYTFVVAYPPPAYPYGTGYLNRYDYDTQRQKYSSVNAELQEYMLERLEGGEWYNYTRTFYSTNYYNVYLRHGSEYTMQLRLDQVTVGPTLNKLGEFYTTNALAKSNYRYAPLLDETGKMAVVNLSGVNTLRLTVDVPQEERTKFGLMLNYMALVPALLVQYSSQPGAGYTFDNTASIEPVTRRITIPQSGAARYYRLYWPGNAVTIKSITVAGGNVFLTYQ